jgi:hypothetical protein
MLWIKQHALDPGIQWDMKHDKEHHSKWPAAQGLRVKHKQVLIRE